MNPVSRFARRTALLAAALVLSSCGSPTQFTDIWTAPDAGQLQADKVLAVFLTADESMRRIGEDEMVRQISERAPAVASYTFLNAEQVKDLDYAKAKTKEMGFDLAVTLRLLGTETKEQWVPGRTVATPYAEPYRTYWGYSRYAWPVVYEPGYMESSTFIQAENNIYSVADDKLLWSGRSESVDPGSVTQLVRSIAAEGQRVLVGQGLLRRDKPRK